MAQPIQTKTVTTFLLETSTKKTLDQICKLNKTTTSDVLRTLINLFLEDYNFQHTILRQVNQNEH